MWIQTGTDNNIDPTQHKTNSHRPIKRLNGNESNNTTNSVSDHKTQHETKERG